ncbi:MAG: hypothetical protein HYX92_12950 [Chloroflexi bacterium]|nr:hypothetical protein [Chloroflexota bacterium]
MMDSYQVVWPLGKCAGDSPRLAERSGDLRGKTVCELWTEGFRGDEMFRVLRKILSNRYPGIRFLDYRRFGRTSGPKHREFLAALPEKLKEHGCDLVVSGVGA